jgi:D-alanine-D-alanine ligase
VRHAIISAQPSEVAVKIALVYNGVTRDTLLQGPLDRTAEFDGPHTVAALREALAIHGHAVTLIEANEEAYERLRTSGVDLVFNVAEGTHGADREAQIPAMLEMLGVPYTGSGPLSLALCLHKGKAKEILSYHGIPTPTFQVLQHPHEPLSEALVFPLIVKLLHEGSSMGLSYDSIVEAPQALVARAMYLMQTYSQPVLVEQFIDGREFTVPILGNTPARALPVIEVLFQGPRNITLFQPDDDVIHMLAQVHHQRLASPLAFRLSANQERALVQTENGGVLEIPVALTKSVCPADIPATLATLLQDTALRAFYALECRDWGRVDMRVGADGIPQVLELNPIAGLDPVCWFPRSARAAGMDYPTLMQTILDLACQRYGL